MNLANHYVTEVLGEPYLEYSHWFLKVMADSYGRITESTLMFKTREEAQAVMKGYEFDA